MKKMMLGMMALCAATAFGDLKIGTVDMMVLVRNHKSYDTNKKMLQDSEKDYPSSTRFRTRARRLPIRRGTR